jgi:hypothetical protein
VSKLMAMRLSKLVLWSSVAIPMASAYAQSGFSFRPTDTDEPPMPQTVSPGWRADRLPRTTGGMPARGADRANDGGYNFAPQSGQPAVANPAPPVDSRGFSHFRYKPEDAREIATPPPLPPAFDPSKDPGMTGYGRQSMHGQAPVAGQPQNPGYASTHGAMNPQGARPEPLPQPQPLQLEGRYIDGANHYPQHSYPFRPLEEESKPAPAISPPPQRSTSQTAQVPAYPQQPYGSYQYPAMPINPVTPGYGPLPYDRGYNTGPTFNGFRFPFSNGGFPFGFK